MTLSEYFRTCGGCLFHITIKKNGIAKGVTEPKGEIVGNEEIQACFTQAGLKPEKGTYSFTLYAEGTRLDTAPSGAHCIMANSLEVAVDARITRPCWPGSWAPRARRSPATLPAVATLPCTAKACTVRGPRPAHLGNGPTALTSVRAFLIETPRS